MYISSV